MSGLITGQTSEQIANANITGSLGEMGVQPAPQVHRFANVHHTFGRVLQHVHAGRRRRLATDAFARAAPHLAPILDHQRLRDEPPRECRRSAFDAEDFGGEPLVVRRVAHLGQACEQSVA